MRDPIFSSPLMSGRTANRLIRMEGESNCLVGICSIIHIFFKLAASWTIEGHSHSGLGTRRVATSGRSTSVGKEESSPPL